MIDSLDLCAVIHYDREAQSLEFALRKRVPLLKWHVLRFKERQEHTPSYVMAMLLLEVEARGVINDREFVAKQPISRDRLTRLEDALIDEANYVANEMVYAVAQTILEWRPEV